MWVLPLLLEMQDDAMAAEEEEEDKEELVGLPASRYVPTGWMTQTSNSSVITRILWLVIAMRQSTWLWSMMNN